MKIEELEKELKDENKTFNGICHDCGKPVEVKATINEEGTIKIEGGAVYKIRQGLLEDELYFKCDECFRKDKILRNFRKTEVYSRAIGYLRPVNQWNAGKKEEFTMRNVFKNTKGL